MPDAKSEDSTIPSGFKLDSKGVWKRDDNKKWRRVCSILQAEADTRDALGQCWGTLLNVTDRDGKKHKWLMPKSLLAGEGREIREKLLNLGLDLEPSKWARDALLEYVSKASPPQRAESVAKIGWHDDVFVLPDATIGTASTSIVLESYAAWDHAFHCSGTLKGWQDDVARYAIGNSRLSLCLCAAAAAPLLRIIGLESGGFHLKGDSSIGKTSGLRIAGSFWGGGGKKGKYIETWRATDNGLEAVAVAHNDALLCLDEISQVDAKAAAATAYMLSNETGKSRANQGGGGEPKATWRILFLSNGEMGLGDKIAEDPRQRRMAGQAVRVVDIDADPKAGFGIFEDLHGFPSGGDLSDHLRKSCQEHYGVPSREFLGRLADGRDHAAKSCAKSSAQFVTKYCPVNADGQVRRVATRFGLVAAAGELAIEFRIFPWPEGEAISGVAKCFQSWLQDRGGTECLEEIEGIKQIKGFLQAHGSSRFESWSEDERVSTIHHRIGWRRSNGDGSVDYLVTPSGWKEMTRGYDSERLAHVMEHRGLLSPGGGGKTSRSVKPPGQPKMRLYHVLAKALSWENNDQEDENT